jgi:hypothetical protein
MKKIVSFLFFEFLPRVAMEFIWLLFTVSLGISVTVAALNRPGTELDYVVQAFGAQIVVLIFNAAAIRVVLYFGLTYIDKSLDQAIVARHEMLGNIKLGIHYALHSLKKQTTAADAAPEDEEA